MYIMNTHTQYTLLNIHYLCKICIIYIVYTIYIVYNVHSHDIYNSRIEPRQRILARQIKKLDLHPRILQRQISPNPHHNLNP